VPVIAQPVLDLEILPGKAQRHRGGAGDRDYIAERIILRRPGNRRAAACGHGDRAVEVVAVDVREVDAFVHRQRRVAEPDVFAQCRAACAVMLGDDVPERIPEIIGDRPALRAVAQFLEPVIQI
jgi:hypothetical protein